MVLSKEENFALQFVNCRILRNHELIKEDLWVRGGKIIDPKKVFFDEQRCSSQKIDCYNSIIAPGYIDLQINGGFGVDFSFDIDTVEEGIRKVAKLLLPYGVTAFCPTLVTSPKSVYHTIIPKIPKTRGGKDGAAILGLHLEGPFINPDKKGAHPENCIRDFENGITSLEETYGNLEVVKIVTLAPEKKNSEHVIKYLKDMGIVVALGHTTASLSDGEKAVSNGATLITHLFNAMLPFHHRNPGLIGLLTSSLIPQDTVYYGIISDGVHTHPTTLKMVFRTDPNGLILVTDAISAMGLEEGTHHIGQLTIELRDKKAYIAQTDTLCGSIATMDECVRVFRASTECEKAFALEAASYKPAKCLGMEKEKGTLDYEADADIIMLDDDLNVLSTWIAGECVFRREP